MNNELDQLSQDRRKARDLFLSVIDKINPIWWESMTNEEKNSWREYRQKLLDVPQQEGFPENVEWPTDPIRQSILDSEVPPDEVIAPE